MALFGKLVKTAVNVGVGLPVAIVKDVFTLGNSYDADNSGGVPFTKQKLEQNQGGS